MYEEGLSVQLDPDAARARKRSVVIAGHATSISLEDAFWRQVSALAEQRGLSINALVAEIDAARSTVPHRQAFPVRFAFGF